MVVNMASSIQSGGGSNSSADFVRKLYSMLEDTANMPTVRWGNEGDTFVVLDNEAFTRFILPKHFKHSNFSSFVRQLNKYDFHKVKRPEDGSQSPYGPNASEFKHSEFRANRKDNLDNIRRKNPAPKKPLLADEQMSTAGSISILNELATTTQQQVQQLQEKIRDMTQSQRVMVTEISNLHKVINAQKQSQHELLNYLTFSRRESRASNPASTGASTSAGANNDGLDELPQELRQAREMLSVADRELERSGALYSTPIESPPTMFSQPGSASLGISSDPMNDISRYPIYPVGQTVGIDPFHSDHINNIPYQLPANQTVPYSAPPAEPTLSAPTSTQVGSSSSVWGRQKPKVLLVEDDQTCSRIGSKFLTTMDCTVEAAPDGIMAFTKVNNAPEHFDLIFMDIVMPGLDGASATDLIRQVAPAIPVIAMTSNIKPEDVQWYAEHGMNGVLAKPFTRDGMLRVLKQHLPHLLKEADTPLHTPIGGFPPVSHVAGLSASLAGGPVKFESTPPAHSPSTTSSSWHSPGGYAQPSPTAGSIDAGFSVALNGNGQLVATQTSAAVQRPGFSPDMPPPGGTSGDDRPIKRPKVYGHTDAFGPR